MGAGAASQKFGVFKTEVRRFGVWAAILAMVRDGLSVIPVTLPEVALISGHRDFRQLFRYTHLRAEDVAKKLS